MVSEIRRDNQLRLVVYPFIPSFPTGFKNHPTGGWPWDFWKKSTVLLSSFRSFQAGPLDFEAEALEAAEGVSPFPNPWNSDEMEPIMGGSKQ